MPAELLVLLIVQEEPGGGNLKTRQGRLEGCHRMSAAMHLMCRLEGMS